MCPGVSDSVVHDTRGVDGRGHGCSLVVLLKARLMQLAVVSRCATTLGLASPARVSAVLNDLLCYGEGYVGGIVWRALSLRSWRVRYGTRDLGGGLINLVCKRVAAACV